MALPQKKLNKLINEQTVEKALEAASKKESAPIELKKDFQQKSEPKKKKVGRPSATDKPRKAVSFYFTQETINRLSLAFAHEKIKRSNIDKSYLIEESLIEWLDSNKY